MQGWRNRLSEPGASAEAPTQPTIMRMWPCLTHKKTATRLREELDERLSGVAKTLAAAVTPNEVNKVYGLIAREVEVHRKAAESKGDKEYSTYLGSRLRRLNEIKTERLAALAAAQEQTA
ncbi:hypothetical protein ACTMMZ_15680 [Escherichia coli]|uniref:hypothetical protein n=1 Tax=Escherichia coli TaxID=562 RepID=UPI003F8B0517